MPQVTAQLTAPQSMPVYLFTNICLSFPHSYYIESLGNYKLVVAVCMNEGRQVDRVKDDCDSIRFLSATRMIRLKKSDLELEIFIEAAINQNWSLNIFWSSSSPDYYYCYFLLTKLMQ